MSLRKSAGAAAAGYLAGIFALACFPQASAQTTAETALTMNFTGTVTGIFGDRNESVQAIGSVTPYGNANLTASLTSFTFTFNDGDSLTAQSMLSSAGGGVQTVIASLTIVSGTGVFQGAAGSAQLTLNCQSDCQGSQGESYHAAFISSGTGTLILPASIPPLLTAIPGILSFSGQAGSASLQQQAIAVQNSGSGSLAFQASVVSASPWVSIAPSSGTAASGVPAAVTVTVNPQALSAGSYRDLIHFSSSAGNADVPVTLFASNAGPILGAGPVGALFNMVQGAGSSVTQVIGITNNGSAGTVVGWTAAPAANSGLPNGNFLLLDGESGQVAANSLGALSLALNSNAATLPAGVYYELVQISAPGAQNSPQYVTAVLNIEPASASVLPNLSPAGLLFVGAAGQPIASQQFTVNWSSPQAQPFQVLSSNPQGLSWLQVSPASGNASTANPAVVKVSINTAGLAAGVYIGTVDLTGPGGSVLGSANVTLILVSGVAGALQLLRPEPARSQAVLGGCTPSALVLTETGIPNNFSVPAGWPSNLVATMTDNCGNAIPGGAVSANFSNGDPPLSFDGQGNSGQYVATWQPSGSAKSNLRIVLQGIAGSLAPAFSQLSGSVTSNQAPVLSQNGIVNGFTFLAGGALAPGTVAAAFGSGLTGSANGISPGVAPLPTEFQNTQLVIGGRLAPLYYLSDTQLNVQIPAELSALQQYPAVAIVNGALTLPMPVTLVPLAPGLAAFTGGSVIAQHNDYTLVDSSSPAHPGESLVIYLVGMGATNPAVASGSVAPGLNPGDPLAQAIVQPVVLVNNQPAHIQFAGLTPGGIGLYQINFVVPPGVPSGSLSLTVSQGGIDANSAALPVADP